MTFTLRLLAFSFFVLGSPLAQTSFFDDFEGDLSQWVGQSGGEHSGILVNDPLRRGNHVLTFTERTFAGDVFGTEVTVMQGQTHVLSFEYLGVPNGGVAGDLGGAIGFAEGTSGRQRWLAGTVFCCGIEDSPLIDDGQWRKYSIVFDVFATGQPGQIFDFATVPPADDTIRVILEDFVESGGVAGDVFFDSIRLSRHPVELLLELIEKVEGLGLHHGTENSLVVKLEAALKALTDDNAGNSGAANGPLGAFQNHVRAQRGKKISEEDADCLIDDAQAILDVLHGMENAVTRTGGASTNELLGGSELGGTELATLAPFGTGCLGTAGMPTLAPAPGSLPRIDGTFTLQMASLPTSPLHQTFGIVGLSRTDWSGITLPQELGVSRCTQYVSIEAAVLLPSDLGLATWEIPVPDDQNLEGLEFFLQGVIVDFEQPTMQITVTNALEGVIGSR